LTNKLHDNGIVLTELQIEQPKIAAILDHIAKIQIKLGKLNNSLDLGKMLATLNTDISKILGCPLSNEIESIIN